MTVIKLTLRSVSEKFFFSEKKRYQLGNIKWNIIQNFITGWRPWKDNTFFYMTILMIFRNVRREPGLKKNGLSERLQTEKQNFTLNIVNFYTKTTSRQRAT